ncbi:MAG TPA: hypothetical protein VFG53_15280 [Anaeromyxobacter sp.]|nr:hypothetical protein [Anaeromyxobacter sp.]
MPRFLIQVDHDPEAGACAQAAKVLLTSGSHYLTHADFGCMDGVHTAWLIAEVENRELARAIVPPAHRARARVVALKRFALSEIDGFLAQHRGTPPAS